jgi:hypothetical protein
METGEKDRKPRKEEFQIFSKNPSNFGANSSGEKSEVGIGRTKTLAFDFKK